MSTARLKCKREGNPLNRSAFAALLALLLWTATDVFAVPLFARQTGQQCVACHVSFPELTNYGRMFKLGGYTIGEKTDIPLAMMAILSGTKINNQGLAAGNDGSQYPRSGSLSLEGASLFYGGKISDHVGIFGQWTFNNSASAIDPSNPANNSVTFNRHSNIDNTDVRYSNRFTAYNKEVIYGFTLNNNPTVQDVFNTTPAFGFPFQTSRTAGGWNVNQAGGINVPPVTTQMEGLGQQVAGVGAYAYYDRHIYAELAAYRTANKGFSILRAGMNPATNASLVGYSPYWRFAYTHDWAENSLTIGTYGMVNRLNTNNLDPTSPSNKFTDFGYDAQFQHISDPHAFTAQANIIRERQNWDSTLVGATRDNATSKLTTFKAKATYYYQRKYGITGSYFSSRTSDDCLQYSNSTINCPANGGTAGTGANLVSRNDTAGYVLELNFLPVQNIRIALQYTMFTKVGGQGSSYALAPDGVTFRNPRDNNLLYLYTWFSY